MSERPAPYDIAATKQTVSLTINSDLYSKAKHSGINASRVAERALAEELGRLEREKIAAEIRQDVQAMQAYAAEHGSFPEMMQEYYESRGDEPV
jgi:post-segregation antitoxin (ccd killing protein)